MKTRVCRLHGQNDIRIETAQIAAPGPGEVRVAIVVGGVCGSDLHYYQDGGFGPIRVREPIILGHEAAGRITAIGPGVTNLAEGDNVAINPSRPCNTCTYCREGLTAHCLAMRFNGSALRFPHEQGLFREAIILDAAQCIPFGAGITFAEAACAEPLAVCLHACAMAGTVENKRVLVTGAGPIGSLLTAVAARGGAAEITVTDLHDLPLDIARKMGATRVINIARDAAKLDALAADNGCFDMAFECSAAAPAIRSAIAAVRPRGRIVQVGVSGDTPIPLNALVGKELALQGTQRFLSTDFAEALRCISDRQIDVRPVVTTRFPMDATAEAFRIAGDRRATVKVQIDFAGTVDAEKAN